MKRFLLSALAVMATMGSFAQVKMAAQPVKSPKMEVPVSCARQYEPTAVMTSQKMNVPRKNFESEMWYVRPKGSFYLGGMYYDDNDELQSYKYLVVPPFTDVKFQNASASPESAKWFIGDNEMTEGIDEDNSFTYSFPKLPIGYVANLPLLENDKENYQVAEYALVCDSMPQLVHPFNYADGGRYYGYSDGRSAFQSGPDNFDFDDDGEAETFYIESFLQYFNKPETPMLLYDVVLWATSPNRNISNISDLQLVFRRWEVGTDEEGKSVRVLGDTIKILNCTSAEFETDQISATAKVYPGTLIFAAEEEDDFGTPTATPFLIDSDYAILLSGFGLDEMDIRFYFTDQGADVEEYETWATPTFLVCCDEEENRLGNLSYWNDYIDQQTGETVRYCYSIAYMFDVIMDGMAIEEGTEEHTAPVEGGESQTEAEQVSATWLFTNLPIFETTDEGEVEWTGYYDFEGVPEWAQIRIDPTYYENSEEEGAENVRGLNLVWFEVEPLPQGVESRSATIKVVSATGMECERVITLTQGNGGNTVKGDVTGDGIVNALDIQAVINAAVADSKEPKFDLNSDGIVNALDIQTVINIAAAGSRRS